MPETLTVEILVEQLRRLRLAFPTHAGTKTPEQIIETAEVYRDGLHGISGEALRAAVRIAIETEKFFPKVVDLRTLAAEWMRRHAPHAEQELKDPLWCPRCRSRVEWLAQWVPKIDARCRPIMREIEGALYIELTTTSRYRCECAKPAAFAPEPDLPVKGNWMLHSRITARYGAAIGRDAGRRIDSAIQLSDEQRQRLEDGAKAARAERAQRTAAREPEHIGDLAENIAAGVLEHA
jgi:hypothetical protein